MSSDGGAFAHGAPNEIVNVPSAPVASGALRIGEGHEVTVRTGSEGDWSWSQYVCSCGYQWSQMVGTDAGSWAAPRCPNVRITQDECLVIHGHCWERTDIVLASNPPQYPEVCKHCGKRRIGTPREPMEYRYPDEPARPS